ncbi:MAG: WecB/TagA/CpsF family glycosyltransferase, partial [Leeuwenhoekiella sp.]
MSPVKKRVLNLDISIGKYRSFVKDLLVLAQSGKSSYVCVANVHMLIEARRDKSFEDIVNNADMVTPDGMPLCKSIGLLHGEQQDRVAGMDLLPDLLIMSEKMKIPVFFYGGTEQLLKESKEICKNEYPELKIAGMHSPPFRVLTPEENIA